MNDRPDSMIPACSAPAEVTPPRIPLPPKACDTHAHVFGPASQFPYAADRSYTPPDAPLAKYLAMLATLGVERGVLVQGSAHGADNSSMLDALARHPERLRGVAVAGADVPPAELRRWHELGVRGLRFNHFFRGGELYYRGGIPLEAARTLAPVMAELGWHMQLWIDVKDLSDTMPTLKALGLPVVIDHMGRCDARAGTGVPGFQQLLRLLGEGGCWVKLSGAHRISQDAPDYPDARPFHEALVAANPNHETRRGSMDSRSDRSDKAMTIKLGGNGMKRALCGILAVIALTATPFLLRPAGAQTAEIRLARQFSMGYLQFNVMENENLIEKHARALGLADVKVSWATFSGPNAMNDALVAGQVDIVAGGVPGLLTLWGRTRGTPQEVRGIATFSSQPFLLNTRNPEVKTIADLTDSDRIAVPAIKVSVQAVMLQMAAAKMFGQSNFGKLDTLAVAMSPPDATIAIMSGAAGVTCVFSVPPFQEQQLETPGIRTILNSFDVMDGPHTFTVAWTSARFRDRNPALYQALFAAMREATEIVNKDRRAAAALWLKAVNAKMPLDKAAQVVSGPQVRWTMVPENTMKFASFMHSVGSLRTAPQSWRDLFFPEIHDANGS